MTFHSFLYVYQRVTVQQALLGIIWRVEVEVSTMSVLAKLTKPSAISPRNGMMIQNKWIKLMHPPGPFIKPARLGVSTVEIPHLGQKSWLKEIVSWPFSCWGILMIASWLLASNPKKQNRNKSFKSSSSSSPASWSSSPPAWWSSSSSTSTSPLSSSSWSSSSSPSPSPSSPSPSPSSSPSSSSPPSSSSSEFVLGSSCHVYMFSWL